MSTIWTEEEASIVHKMVENDKLYREISEVLQHHGFDRSPEAVRKFYKRTQDEFSDDPGEYDIISPEIDTKIEDKYALALERIAELRDQMINVSSERFVRVGRPVEATTKVLSLSDLHIPFHNSKVIEHMVSLHSDADVLVLNGDILEMFLVSKWPKNRTVLLKHEYEVALEFIKMFSSIFPRVVLVSGNHEYRSESYFSAHIDPAVSFLVHTDVLERLAKGYGFDEEGEFIKKYDFKNVHYDGGILKWYTIVGKTIFVHPRDFSSVPMRTAINWAQYFLTREDFECLVMSHTHKQGSYIWHNRLILEQGCCCVPLDYESQGRNRATPQSFGGCVIYMDNEGHVDFDKSKNVYYGTGAPIKVEDAMRLL